MRLSPSLIYSIAQVLDIHEEARRIADTHKAAGTTPTPASYDASTKPKTD